VRVWVCVMVCVCVCVMVCVMVCVSCDDISGRWADMLQGGAACCDEKSAVPVHFAQAEEARFSLGREGG
jgi:hypothetical protein